MMRVDRCHQAQPILVLFLQAAAVAAAAAGKEATCAAGAGKCGAAGDYYWPTQKGDAGRTGFSPFTVPDIVKPPTWTWEDPHQDTIRATPLIDEKKNVYLSTVAGRVYKFDQHGKMLWRKRLQTGIPAVGCLYGGKLFLPMKIGRVVAMDMETGLEVWNVLVSTVHVTSPDTASVFCQDGIILSATHNIPATGSGNSDVVAQRAEDGKIMWRFNPDVYTFNFQASSPGDDTVVFQDRSGGLYRLGLSDGQVIWKSGKRGPLWQTTFTTGAAVCHEGRVFVVSNNFSGTPSMPGGGILHTYALDDGKLLWEQGLMYAANQAVTVGPNPADKSKSIAVVGMGSNPQYPFALVASAIGVIGADPVSKLLRNIAEWVDLNLGFLFVNNPSAMAAYDAETGGRLWHYELPAFRKPSTSGDSERYSQRSSDLTSMKNPYNDNICLPDSCSQPVIGPDGTAYMGWQDGRIYAIKDANGDGKIDKSEVSWYQVSDGFQGSMGLAPGMFAAAPCGGGLYVWTT